MSRSFTAHVDTFALDRLPRPEDLPEFLFEGPDLQFPERLNCAAELLDARVAAGDGERVCLRTPAGEAWTYAELQHRANQVAQVLVDDLGVVPGNRVLLRGANTPMLVACWFGVVKAGAIAVATMPMLRARELAVIVEKAQVSVALTQHDLRDELLEVARIHPVLQRVLSFVVRPAAWMRRWKGRRGLSRRCPPRPPTPACSPSPRAPPGSPRRRCTSTAT